jgi:hypothetical protein
MRPEIDCKSSERYLYADAFFTDKVIQISQEECRKRLKDREKNIFYDNYVNWIRQEDEIAVFTLYAYADFDIPKRFDCIFNCDNSKHYEIVNFELTQSIWEAWFPINSIDHGHKHLCIFKFDDEIPDIINLLHKEDNKFSSVPKKHVKLGFCNSSDLPAISEQLAKVLILKEHYGDKWWAHYE